VSWSPDGRKLAFVSTTFAEGGLWVMNAEGSHPVRLVDVSNVPPGAPWSPPSRPTWSPDSRRIAFAATRNGGRGIWAVNADGSNLRQLTTRWAEAPDWSPDGGEIAFVGAARGYGIYLMNVDGSNQHKLAPLTGGWRPDMGAPDWSPDGRVIVFTHMVPFLARNGVNVQPNDEIWVMDAGGGSRVRLTGNHVSDYDPVWSPDGTKIAFVAAFAGPGSSEIYVINPDGTGFTRLTHNHVTERSPAWQPVAAP
jgi:Tol biopolymer transport system component